MGSSLAFKSKLKENTIALFRKLHLFKPEPTLEQKCSKRFPAVLEKARKGDFDGTMKHLDRILEIDPKNVQAHALKGLVYLELQMYSMAETEFNNAVQNSLTVRKQDIKYSVITEYISLKYSLPSPNIDSMAYMQMKDAMICLSLGFSERAMKEFEAVVRFAKQGKQH